MTTSWAIPTNTPSLPADELHVWRASLTLNDSAVAVLGALLSPDERARAARFRMLPDRRRYTAARGTLRTLLGQTLDRDPASLSFAYGLQGKPSLPAAPDLAFNVSHSGDVALIALRWGKPIGVDIEQIRPDMEWLDIAARFYSPNELAWLHSLPSVEQVSGFFRLWTRKEAYLKARGEGIWHDLSRFDVTRSLVAEDGEDTAWHLQDLEADKDFKAAVCVQGVLPMVRLWRPQG